MMLTKNTAQSLGISDRTDAEQSISGGAQYLQDMMAKVPETVPEGERIWFALAAYNMGYAHMLDARALTAKTKGNPDSWSDVKQRLPLLSQKQWYQKLTYGYARGHEAYAYVENIRKYQISPVGYLLEKEKRRPRRNSWLKAIRWSHRKSLITLRFQFCLLLLFCCRRIRKSHLTDPNILVQVPRR